MSIMSYFKETKEELKHVRFPSMSLTITFTTLVIVVSVLVAVVLGGADIVLRTLLAKVLG